MTELTPNLSSRETYPEPSLQTLGRGVDRADAFIAHILRNEKVGGKKFDFGTGILQELHRRVLFFMPGWAGNFRVNDETRFTGKIPVRADKLKDQVYLFEAWLGDEIEGLRSRPEDIEGALRLAAAAHHGLVSELHPFDDGNKRVARALINGILAVNAKEGLVYNYYILPVPQLREQVDEKLVERLIREGKEPKLIPYLQAIKDTDDSWSLNPFEVFLAIKWVGSLDDFLMSFERRFVNDTRGAKRSWKSFLSKGDLAVVEKIEQRRRRLQQFIKDDLENKRLQDKIPDYFAPRYKRLEYETF